MRNANRGCSLIRIPSPVPLWGLPVFWCWDQFLLNLYCFRTLEFRASLGTNVLLRHVWKHWSCSRPGSMLTEQPLGTDSSKHEICSYFKQIKQIWIEICCKLMPRQEIVFLLSTKRIAIKVYYDHINRRHFYPRATRCGGDIVTLLWFRPCVRVCVCVCVHVSVTLLPCERNRNWTVAYLFTNLAVIFTMTRGWTLLILEVRGQRSRSQ